MGDLRIMRIGHGWLDGMTDLPPEVLIYINDAHQFGHAQRCGDRGRC